MFLFFSHILYLLMNALFTIPRTRADNQLFITKQGITRLQVSRVDSDRDPREWGSVKLIQAEV